ncbi:cobalt-precorrin 5A hydrolase / precorrin-3B C17-methyltransferase [Tistlia consotensis]|uniref:Cobalt-precorrin 5A hydrolase / precorrin-3B C17-methyltransferase n=1 Tax=Tistlia consotensis USBA 355 TaxID=560819 RepID=A0A1Y6B6K7_9PROT|nr:precorrin-3B C(17)-methyltransferase [Tistlia consotensis]SME93001.1 cobalt-precorrin 5A hydrolase / precorrin-3B C17-methyltransferase [Tistlia consotensis USBA 355]SNR28386.1 cobalt-precorrin 5A hydrolase / precorrin-3B C17-methyltransferase [Tistlia consotensis]
MAERLEARPAVVVLSQGGLASGRKAAELLGGELLGLAGRVEGAETVFQDTGETLRALFAAGRPLVGLCAAGILVRCLAPLLGDKRAEPPVLALAEDGSAVVPLLGGHRGANDLARRLAGTFGVAPAVTTAGDLRLGVALDAPPPGWRLANPEHARGVMARLLAGEAVRIEGEAAWLEPLPQAPDAGLVLRATGTAEAGDPATLVYHPPLLALGVGCERGCAPEELRALVRDSLAEAGLAEAAVAGVFSLDLKADEPAVQALAAALGVPARFFGAGRLEQETPRLATPSDLVFAEVGCHGVAEAAALAAAGAEAALVLAKRKSRRATCAVALAPAPLEAAGLGRPRGALHVVGIGPGQEAWRTPEAGRLIAEASDLVGYGLYLDLLGPLAAGKTRHDYALGEEELRVRAALDLAAEGRTVALVCSGDAGIYAMATLVFELLERGGRPDWGRVEVVVTPGISALQAAAARAGAPLGHDFCTISLSDLLTPWPAIERRLKAAAEGDFVVAFYNPVSRRRTWQLARAREILLERRPAETPVILAGNLGRPAETIRLRTLGSLDPAEVDMLTVVLVGSSESRRVARSDGGSWVYTPRGYAAKAEKEAG